MLRTHTAVKGIYRFDGYNDTFDQIYSAQIKTSDGEVLESVNGLSFKEVQLWLREKRAYYRKQIQPKETRDRLKNNIPEWLTEDLFFNTILPVVEKFAGTLLHIYTGVSLNFIYAWKRDGVPHVSRWVDLAALVGNYDSSKKQYTLVSSYESLKRISCRVRTVEHLKDLRQGLRKCFEFDVIRRSLTLSSDDTFQPPMREGERDSEWEAKIYYLIRYKKDEPQRQKENTHPAWLTRDVMMSRIIPALCEVKVSKIANKCGICTGYVYRLLRGEQLPRRSMWITLAELVGITREEALQPNKQVMKKRRAA